MGTPIPFSVIPKFWHGVRDNQSPTEIMDEEWVDAREVDGHLGERRSGLAQYSFLETAEVRGLGSYYRQDGSRNLITMMSSGKLYDGASNVLSGLSGSVFPSLAAGSGYIIVVNGVNAPKWRDPADGVWKDLQGVPAGWIPKYATVHPLNRRLYIAPTPDGQDFFAWSNPDFVGTDLAFNAAGGGGAESIGGRREPITALSYGLGDDICIFGENYIYQVKGNDPTSWAPRFISGDIGTLSHRSVVVIGHGLHFVHLSGNYLVNALGAVTFPPLTDAKDRAWKVMAKTYPEQLKFCHASWSSNERIIYLFIPTSASEGMGQLWKFYLPDGSISVHDVSAFSSTFFNAKLLIGRADGKVADLLGGDDDLGVAIQGSIRSKIYGGTRRIKVWGTQEKMVMLFRPLTSGVVSVRPDIYREGSADPIVGTWQDVSLQTSGDVVRATINLPSDQGWGLQLNVKGTQKWNWLGFDVDVQEEDIE